MILMQKIDMNDYFDELAVQAGQGSPGAKEVLCRHFRTYIHNLARSCYHSRDVEDAEQDLWVCFLECLLLYEKKRKIHFRFYALTYLKWKMLNFYRSRKVDEKYIGEFTEKPCLSSGLEKMQELTEKETESVLAKCPLSRKQRFMVKQRLSGKSYKDMAEESRESLRNIYYHMGRIQAICAGTREFQESFFA